MLCRKSALSALQTALKAVPTQDHFERVAGPLLEACQASSAPPSSTSASSGAAQEVSSAGRTGRRSLLTHSLHQPGLLCKEVADRCVAHDCSRAVGPDLAGLCFSKLPPSCTARAGACSPLHLPLPHSACVHCRLGRVRRTVICLSWRACSAWQPPGRGLSWPQWPPGEMSWHMQWHRQCPQASSRSDSSLSMLPGHPDAVPSVAVSGQGQVFPFVQAVGCLVQVVD